MLYVVATPIGNLGDISTRAREALCSVDTVLAEDTRVTRKLLNHIEAKPRLERFDEHTAFEKTPAIVERVLAGERIALVSDAGTPGISDPGQGLVDAVLKSQIDSEVGRISSDAFEEIERDPCAEHISSLVSEAETKARRSDISEAEEKSLPIPNPDTHYSSFVRVIPGPSAVIAALVASGLPSDTFYFGGFLPRKAKALRDVLQTLATLDATLVFYESPQRLVKTLDACAEVLGERRAAVVRELTKMHEEVVRDQLPQLAAQFSARDSIKGEIVLVIALAQREKVARVHVDKYGG